MNRRISVLFTIAMFFLPGLGGCNSCDKDRPYVPYKIDPATSSGLGASATAPVVSVAPKPPEKLAERFEPVVAKRVKAAPSKLQTAAGPVTAPQGTSFELLLEGDLTGDGKPDAVAWMRSAGGAAGELVQFAAAREGGPLQPRILVPLPADLTLETGCNATTDLRQVGPRTLAMSFRRVCGEGGDARITEWKAVVVPVRDPAVRLNFLIDHPSKGKRLEIDLDGLDRDGDEFDDLLVTARLPATAKRFEEPSAGETAVTLHYFDRPAGLSRDPHEPAASFGSLARKIERDATGAARNVVPVAARQARRLHRMLCAEAGHPRVRVGGAPLQCGATDAMHRLTKAELHAAIASGHLLSALGAFERLRALGASAKETDEARKAFEKAAPRRDVDSYFLPFGPSAPPESASWGRLAFDKEGALLIRTDASVMRFDPKTRVAVPDPDSGPVTPWGTRVQAPQGGSSLVSIVDSCDGGLLVARMSRNGSVEPVLLPVDPVTTRGCAGTGQRAVAVRPVLWSEKGLALIVAGTPLWLEADGSKVQRRPIPQGRGPRGGPKSPDGESMAHASSLGVLVSGEGGKGRLWRTDSMASGYDRLTACTASNGASAVACIEGSRTRVFLPKGR